MTRKKAEQELESEIDELVQSIRSFPDGTGQDEINQLDPDLCEDRESYRNALLAMLQRMEERSED